MPLSRREFMQRGMGVLAYSQLPQGLSVAKLRRRAYRGATLSGWRVTLGDGMCAAPGVALANLNDIKTVPITGASELRANIRRRQIMVHNITYKRIVYVNALPYKHEAQFQFRVPYLPAVGNPTLNGQTVEAGLFAWDGAATRYDYGAAFQWCINPYDLTTYGKLFGWTGINWTYIGELPVDTRWHTARLTVDFPNGTAGLVMDGQPFLLLYSQTPKHPKWGTTIDARFQVEIVNMDVCSGLVNGTAHVVRVKNWSWVWTP